MSKLHCAYCMNELEIDSSGLCVYCGMNPSVSSYGPINIQGMSGESIIKYKPFSDKARSSFGSYKGHDQGIYGDNIAGSVKMTSQEIDTLISFGNNFISFVLFTIISLGIFWFKVPFLLSLFLKILALFQLPVPQFLVT